MTQSRRILIITNGANSPHSELEKQGFSVTCSNDCDMAFEVLVASPFDLVAIDSTPEREAIEFIRRVRATSQLAGILILVLAEWGTGDPTLALASGADAYEPTPIDSTRLITSIERLLRPKAVTANLEIL